MSGYFRSSICLLCLAAALCCSCSRDKVEDTAPETQPQKIEAAPEEAATPEPEAATPDYFRGAQLAAQPGGIPQNLRSIPVQKTYLRPADEKSNPTALSDGRPESVYRLDVEPEKNPLIIYDLGPLSETAPLYGVYINVKNAAEEGRKPIDYRPFMFSIKFVLADGSEAPAVPTAEKTAEAEGEKSVPRPMSGTAEIDAAINEGAYLALVKTAWRSINGEQVVLFDRPFEFKREKNTRLMAEIEYVFGEEKRRFLEIAELGLLTAKNLPGAAEPLPVDKLAVPGLAGCYRNREGRRIDIYASGLMRLAVPSATGPTPDQPAEANRSPQGAPPPTEASGNEIFAVWRELNGRLYFNPGGNGEISCETPGSGLHDFTPDFRAMQRDTACSDPWGDISSELLAADLGNRNDISAVWRSDCDGDRRPELVVYMKNKKKVVILRHEYDWDSWSLWREMELSGDFRLYSDPVSGNCMLCEKNETEGGWWINIFLSNNWYRSSRLTLPGE